MKYDSALTLLRDSYLEGLDKPMQVVSDSRFYPLIDNPSKRSKIRLLLEEFAVENQAKIVRKEEPGESIVVTGQVVDESNNMPIKQVKMDLVQADKTGLYFEENSNWNPRIFAYLRTDDNGNFSICTIKPGRYKDDNGDYVPAHVHFTLAKNGYRGFGGEFTFEDDSIFIANGNAENVLVAKIQKASNNQYYVTIPMQKE